MMMMMQPSGAFDAHFVCQTRLETLLKTNSFYCNIGRHLLGLEMTSAEREYVYDRYSGKKTGATNSRPNPLRTLCIALA